MNTEPQYTLSVIGLGEIERRLLATLTRISTKSGGRWRFADDAATAAPDALIIDPLVSFAHPQVQQALASGHPTLVGFRRSQLQSRVNVLTLNSPVRPTEFEQLLAVLTERLDESLDRRRRKSDDSGPAAAVPPHADSSPHDAETPELSANREPSLAQAIVSIMLEGVGVFGLELHRKLRLILFLPEAYCVVVGPAYDGVGGLVEELRASADAWRWRPLDDEEWIGDVADRERLALATLRWCAGLAMPPGRLHPELSEALAFRLVRWPDFGSFGGSPAGFRLASLMTRAPRGLDELAAAVSGRRGDVIAFLNACHSGDLLVQTRPIVTEPRTIGSQPRRLAEGLIGRLRKALGIVAS